MSCRELLASSLIFGSTPRVADAFDTPTSRRSSLEEIAGGSSAGLRSYDMGIGTAVRADGDCDSLLRLRT